MAMTNKEKIEKYKEKRNQYYIDNKERILAKRKADREANIEDCRLYERMCYEKNKEKNREKMAEYQKKYQKKYQEQIKAKKKDLKNE